MVADVNAVNTIGLLLGIASFAGMVWALVDAARQPDAAWKAVGRSRAAWIVVIALFNGIGALLYAIGPRPQLKAAAAVLREPLSTAESNPEA